MTSNELVQEPDPWEQFDGPSDLQQSGATEVAPNVWTETTATYDISIPGLTGRLDFTATYGGYQCDSVELYASANKPITSDKLRGIAIGRIASQLLREHAMFLTTDGEFDVAAGLDTPIRAALLETWPNGDTKELLRAVAFTYELANALGEYPTAAVQRATSKSRATASRMVAAARRAGLIRSGAENA